MLPLSISACKALFVRLSHSCVYTHTPPRHGNTRRQRFGIGSQRFTPLPANARFRYRVTRGFHSVVTSPF